MWWDAPSILAPLRWRQADPWIRGYSGLQNKFQDGQDYTEKPYLKKKTKRKLNLLHPCVQCNVAHYSTACFRVWMVHGVVSTEAKDWALSGKGCKAELGLLHLPGNAYGKYAQGSWDCLSFNFCIP